MADSMDQVVHAMLETPAAGKVLIQSLNDSVVLTRQGLTGVLAQQLHHSCYGQGPVTAPHVPSQHLRVTSGDMTLTGDAYIGAIKIRGNLVSTALRSARGCPNHDTDATAAADQSPWVTSYRCVLGLMQWALQGTTRRLIWCRKD